jgi:hypothetical protein
VLPFHHQRHCAAHEFHGCARHGRALALRERPVFLGFQDFHQSLERALREARQHG